MVLACWRQSVVGAERKTTTEGWIVVLYFILRTCLLGTPEQSCRKVRVDVWMREDGNLFEIGHGQMRIRGINNLRRQTTPLQSSSTGVSRIHLPATEGSNIIMSRDGRHGGGLEVHGEPNLLETRSGAPVSTAAGRRTAPIGDWIDHQKRATGPISGPAVAASGHISPSIPADS